MQSLMKGSSANRQENVFVLGAPCSGKCSLINNIEKQEHSSRYIDSEMLLDKKSSMVAIINSLATTKLFKKNLNTKIVVVIQQSELKLSAFDDVIKTLSGLFLMMFKI